MSAETQASAYWRKQLSFKELQYGVQESLKQLQLTMPRGVQLDFEKAGTTL